jgi:hypothetical protein
MWNATSISGLRSLAGARLGLGIGQGIALWLLFARAEVWAGPATSAWVFAPLLLLACFVPLVVIAGLGNMRYRTLLAWAIASAVLLACFAEHDIFRAADNHGWLVWRFLGGEHDARIWPSRSLVVSASAALFIAQTLIVAGDADRAFVAAHSLYFDAVWKHVLQAAASALFVAALWLLLSLGAGLFGRIGIAFFPELVREPWFALPATTLAVAFALHVTDGRAGMLRGIRNRALILLSWLLPVVTLLVAGFLAALPFTGFAPLWSTRFATGLLLTAAAALALLINAAYQDGLPEHEPPLVLRHIGRAAALMLIPLVAIAAYALALRVAQYGWTGKRVLAMAGVMVAACYALGYAMAAIGRGGWLRWIEPANLAGALAVLAALFLLSTPIADPARLSVLDQLARLDAGVVTPEEFDFDYLRFDGARYGVRVLERLKFREEGPGAEIIRRRAEAASLMEYRGSPRLVAPKPSELAANITVYPRGRALPPSFLAQDWSQFKSWDLPRCLADASAGCDAFLLDLNRNGQDDIILDDYAEMIVMTADKQGRWSRVGHLVGPTQCKELKDELHAGKFEAAAPQWSDVKVGAMRLELAEPLAGADCR